VSTDQPGISSKPDTPPRGVVTLVVENDPSDDARLLGTWLSLEGLDLVVCRPHAGDDLPETLDGYAAVVVLGGPQHAYPDADQKPGAPWFGRLESLLRKAVRHRVPTLGVCLGAQLLASANGGVVEPGQDGPELGARLVARRDIADNDPLFAEMPFVADVVQWHGDVITELPLGAVRLAASTRYLNQAFRVGQLAWGIQFHIECDLDMVARWALRSVPLLLEIGEDGIALLEGVERALPDVEAIWRPFAGRFAGLVKHRPEPDAAPRSLPVVRS
jgi:GMP synthase-like glutamine amidotransferase